VNSIKSIFSFSLLLALFSTVPSIGICASNSSEEKKDIENRREWVHEFPTRVIKTEVLPGTYFAVTTIPKSKKDPEGNRLWLMDGKGGDIVWKGLEAGVNIVAGDPYPVVVQQSGSQLHIKAFDRKGNLRWKRSSDSTSLSVSVDSQKGEILILEAERAWWEGSPTTLVNLEALSLKEGTSHWKMNLGSFDLPPVVPPNVMKPTSDHVWIAVGGKVLKISRRNQKVVFNNPIEVEVDKKTSPVWRWDISGNNAALIIHNRVQFIDGTAGVKWSKQVDMKKSAPQDVALEGDVLVARFLLVKKERPKVLIIGFDQKSGAELWRYEGRDGGFAKWDRVQSPPAGMVVYKGKVIFCLGKKVLWLDVKTGEIVQTEKMSKGEYNYVKTVKQYNNRLLVLGKFQVRVYDLDSTKLLWHNENLAGPGDREMATRKLGQGLMGIGFQFQGTLAEWNAQSARNMAEMKWAGRTKGDTNYSDYVFSPSARSQFLSAAHGAEASAAWAKVGQSLTEFPGGQKFVKRIFPEEKDGSLVRAKIKGKNSAFASVSVSRLALVDIETGELRLMPTPKMGLGCVSAISADLDGDRLYHAIHKATWGCKSSQRVEAFRLSR